MLTSILHRLGKIEKPTDQVKGDINVAFDRRQSRQEPARPAALTATSGAALPDAGGANVPPDRLTGVCKNEIIATNRPRHLWIPACAGMIEWA